MVKSGAPAASEVVDLGGSEISGRAESVAPEQF
jgi:hypothetical protein